MALNPLLTASEWPALESITPEHVLPAIASIVADNEATLERVLSELDSPSWDSVGRLLDDLNARLHEAWAPVSHLHGVMNGDALRLVYDEALPLLTRYHTAIGHNERLYRAFSSMAADPSFDNWPEPRRKAVVDALRDFHLGGVTLPPADKQRFAALQERLSALGTRFSNHVLDATQGWSLHLEDDALLEGVPDAVRQSLRQVAGDRQLTGWVITLDLPIYLPVMQYARRRELRAELYRAYATRASELGPDAGRWDNSRVMVEILAARREMAALLGYGNYVDYSLASKMAATSNEVEEFLRDLARRSKPLALAEFRELEQYAREKDGLAALEAWDVPYYSEQLRQERYAISQQELRPYFPLERVLAGLFELAGRLFEIEVEPVGKVPAYHPSVRLYRVLCKGEQVASFYLDPFARDNKRGGAWMASCRGRRLDGEGVLHRPLAFLVCNFTPPVGDVPSLLTHDEVTTLFHEFGHGLHHMLTRVDVASVAGINGVAWDAVELPSQFMENWCWEEPSLALIAGHYETGEPLPTVMLQRLLRARNFQSGMQMLRQLEFGLFDLVLHRDFAVADDFSVQQVIDAVRAELSVVPAPPFNRFQHSFTHIFAGGYAAGYYSYKWAERLSADAFARFEEEGLFNLETGRSFRQTILEAGGARPAEQLFRDFRGRDPQSEALLRHCGIVDVVPSAAEGAAS